MRTSDYHMIITSGIIAFALAAILSGVCYWISTIAARLASPSEGDIPFSRLIFISIFVAAWLLFYVPHSGKAHAGNFLDPDFWYHISRGTGFSYGAVSILGWFVAAIIECVRQKRSSPNN